MYDTPRKTEDVTNTVAKVPAKQAKGEEKEGNSNVDEAPCI